jgi:serine/threonine-protein kinase
MVAVEHPETALEPGSRLDRYELLCPIAKGGMASVWLARLSGKHGFEKLVAIKTILPQFAADLRFQKMFLDEARIASGIEHANVAQILDLGEQHEVLYLVMEWIDGDSLARLFRAVSKAGEKLPLAVLGRIMLDTCAGLHAAHELTDKDGKLLGVVHRDVSPQNVLVSVKGIAKLIDFGIAKARDRAAGETNAGLLKGKVQYMAPEQALGKPIDRRADVWAVGAVLYHLLSGTPPFEGENQLATLHLLSTGEPPKPLPESVPGPIAAVVAAALDFDPEKRIATAAELGRRLEDALLEVKARASHADVAAFVGRFLAERAAARRKAVELALKAASDREQLNSSVMTAMRESMVEPQSSPDLEGEPAVPATSAPRSTSSPDLSVSGDALSGGTLGRAAVATPSGGTPTPPRPRTWIAVAAAIGVAALIGAAGLGAGLMRARTAEDTGGGGRATERPHPTGAPTSTESAPLPLAPPSALEPPEPSPAPQPSGPAPRSSATTKPRPTARPTTPTPRPTVKPKPTSTGRKPIDDGF